MNPTPYIIKFLILATSASLVFGQQSSTASSAGNEDPILLSPFTVEAEEDEGYASSIVTSGSRLRTELRDVAASVSVLTQEFMDDLGASDVSEVVAFLSGGDNDNTSDPTGANVGQGYDGSDFGDRNNRVGEISIRGLGRASSTMNFVEVLGSTDRYSISRSEMLRGANSILFGIAEPAGLVNSSTKLAMPNRNSNRIEARFDEFGSNRFVLDMNRVLIQDKLAFRIAGVRTQDRYKVKTAYNNSNRVFLAATYRPTRNTTIRGYYENFKVNGRRPNFRIPADNVSDWLEAYNTYGPLLTDEQRADAFYWDPSSPVGTTTGRSPVIITLPGGETVNLGSLRRDLSSRPQGTAFIYPGTGGDWDTLLDDTVTIFANRRTSGGLLPVAARQYFVRSAALTEEGRAPGFFNRQVTDKGIFPYDTVEISALPGAFQIEEGDRRNLSIEHRFSDDLNVQFTFQEEHNHRDQSFNVIAQSQQISVDITQRLPDGRDNPNFLRPFIYGRPFGDQWDRNARDYVLQANYDFDFAQKTDRLGWLGFHRLTTVLTRSERDSHRLRPHYIVSDQGPIPGVFDGNAGRLSDQARWTMQMWYVGDPVQMGDTSLRFTEFPTNTAAHANRSFDYRYFQDTGNTGTWQQSPTQINVSRLTSTAGRLYNEQLNEGIGVSLQSFFWDRRIVTLIGAREDSIEVFEAELKEHDVNLVVLGGSRSDYLPFGDPTFSDSQRTATASVVVHATNALRFFVNSSENFAVTAPRRDNLYRTLPPQQGETQEFGVGLSLFQQRLSIKLTHFESTQLNASGNSRGSNIEIGGFENALRGALENADRLDEWFTITEGGQTTTEPYDRPGNIAALQDTVSKGQSLEISFNPTRRWNLVASIDKIDNKVTNVGRQLNDFLAIRGPYYQQFINEGLRVDGTSGPDGTPASALIIDRLRSPFLVQYTSELEVEGTSNRGVAEYTAAMVVRYRFDEGFLRGLNVGANLRWESDKIVSFPLVPTTYSFEGLTDMPGFASDVNNPISVSSIMTGGMFASYTRRIFDDRVNWRVQLNYQNAFSETGLRVTKANPDGSPVYSLAPDRKVQLSTSFDF